MSFCRRAALTFVELLHAQTHAGERRAQIVRHRGEGAFPLVEKFADARLHAVERLRGFAHFGGTGFRKGRSVDVAAEAVGGAGEPAQRLHAEIEGQKTDDHKNISMAMMLVKGKYGMGG